MLHYLNDKFEKEKQAQAMFEKYYDLEGSKYYQMTKEDIIAKWDATTERSIDLGHALDDFTGLTIEPENMKIDREMWKRKYGDDEEIMNIVRAWYRYWKGLEELGWKLVTREQHLHKLYNGHTVSGKADIILYYPPSNTIAIIDWKTTDKLVSATKRLNPIHGPEWTMGMTQEKLTHAGMQASVYRDMVEDLIPSDKVYNIVTAIVNVKKDGSVSTYKDPVQYNKKNINDLMLWCIEQQMKDPDWEKDMKS